MRHLKSLLATTCFIGLSIISSSANAMGAYQFHFQLPTYMNWVTYKNEQDPAGYTISYITQAPRQAVTINYGVGITTSLIASMQEVLDNHNAIAAAIGCSINTYHIVKQTDNYMIFTSKLDQCSNGVAHFEVDKTYNMPDGQYDIIYSADPNITPPKMIQQMTRVVESTEVS